MIRIRNEYSFICARAIACMLLHVGVVHAGYHDSPNTVQIENVTVAPRDAKTATVSYDITWRGRRHEGNHLAVWAFYQVRADGATDWQPARLVADNVLNPKGYGQEAGGTPLDYIVPGEEFRFNITFYDDDDGTGIRHWLQLAPGMAPGLPRAGAPASVPMISGNTAVYPRFVLEK